MKNASHASPLLFIPLSHCYNPLFSVYPFRSWLNTPHICLIRRFKAKEMFELSASCLPLFRMGGILPWEGRKLEGRGRKKSKKWGKRENETEKGEKEENFESVIGYLKNTLTTRFRTAWDLSEITLKPKYKNTTREI